ncbi:hypothetical protein [Bacillus sp. FJAT-52991]|uniref:Recombinase zinc beta ribbon domain-containing protein n=1 Tax=Bacillus kandeliae TaxID=3129297 RepID=A0ABZ2NB83_9BACI
MSMKLYTYQLIQEERKQRQEKYRVRENQLTKVHILRRTHIRCAICGNTLSVLQKGTKNKPRFYIEHQKRERPPVCSEYRKYFNTDRIEKGIETALKSILSGDKMANRYLNIESNEKEMKLLKKQIDRNKKALTKLETKLERLLDLYLDGDITKDELSKKRKGIDGEIVHLTETLTGLMKKYELLEKEELNTEYVYEYLSTIRFYDDELTPIDKVKIMGRLFPKATLYPDQIVLHLHINGIVIDVPIKAAPARKPRGGNDAHNINFVGLDCAPPLYNGS